MTSMAKAVKHKGRFLLVADSFLGTAGTGYSGPVGGRLFGGAEVYLYDLAHTLREAGWTVTVLQRGDHVQTEEIEGLTVETVAVPRWWRWLAIVGLSERFHLYGWLLRPYLARGYDRVHFHYFYQAFPFGDATMTGTCHGIEWDCPDQPLWERWSQWLTKRVAAAALQRLGGVVANDTFFLRYVQSELPDLRTKITVIPNYVRTDLFHPRVRADQALRGRFPDEFLILLPKNPARARGTDLAIRALTYLRDRPVRLLITGTSGVQKEFEDLAQQEGVFDRVTFLGHQDHHQAMPGLLRAVDTVIVPSFCREATALAALEGMAVGRPTIVTNIGGLPDLMEDRVTGRIISPTPKALADALREFIDHPPLRTKLGEQGAAAVRHHFSYRVWQARYGDFFTKDSLKRKDDQ